MAAPTSGRGGAPVPRKAAVYVQRRHGTRTLCKSAQLTGPHARSVGRTDPSKRRGENHFDDFGEYMQVKMRKLAEQLDKPACVHIAERTFAGSLAHAADGQGVFYGPCAG